MAIDIPPEHRTDITGIRSWGTFVTGVNFPITDDVLSVVRTVPMFPAC
jgi:hypothetical protein